MRGLTGYQRLTIVTVIAIIVLIAIGSLVRATGSGLGCPDWPTCHGAWIPPLERTAIIEYSHRSAAMVVSLLLLAMLVETLRSHRADRALLWVVLASIPLLAFQAWLGKVTVEHLEENPLSPTVLTLHLATSLLLLAVVCTAAALAVLGRDRERIVGADRASVLRTIALGAVVTYIVLLSGAYVVKAEATTACISWPGCSAAPIPFVDGGWAQSVHWAHRLIVVLGAGAVGAVFLHVQYTRSAGAMLRRASVWLLVVYGLQVLGGAANVWTNFSGAARVAHLAVGAVIWALMVTMAVAGRYRPAART